MIAAILSLAAAPADKPTPLRVVQTCTRDCVPRSELQASEARSRYRLRQWRASARQVVHLRGLLRERTGPSVSNAITLASRVFGVPESEMRAVASCESHFFAYAENGRYKGVFQLGWSPFGLSPFDPYANALSAAQTVRHDGSWRQWECKP